MGLKFPENVLQVKLDGPLEEAIGRVVYEGRGAVMASHIRVETNEDRAIGFFQHCVRPVAIRHAVDRELQRQK